MFAMQGPKAGGFYELMVCDPQFWKNSDRDVRRLCAGVIIISKVYRPNCFTTSQWESEQFSSTFNYGPGVSTSESPSSGIPTRIENVSDGGEILQLQGGDIIQSNSNEELISITENSVTVFVTATELSSSELPVDSATSAESIIYGTDKPLADEET